MLVLCSQIFKEDFFEWSLKMFSHVGLFESGRYINHRSISFVFTRMTHSINTGVSFCETWSEGESWSLKRETTINLQTCPTVACDLIRIMQRSYSLVNRWVKIGSRTICKEPDGIQWLDRFQFLLHKINRDKSREISFTWVWEKRTEFLVFLSSFGDKQKIPIELSELTLLRGRLP